MLTRGWHGHPVSQAEVPGQGVQHLPGQPVGLTKQEVRKGGPSAMAEPKPTSDPQGRGPESADGKPGMPSYA